MPAPLTLTASIDRFRLREPFVISRGVKTEAIVVTVEVTDGQVHGRGECVPYARYGETAEGVVEALNKISRDQSLTSHEDVAKLLPAGAARNALDCAMWDLTAKREQRSVASLLGLQAPTPRLTCFTLSLGTPDEMATAARAVPHLKLLKLKLGGTGDDDRMRAVRNARPDARLVADANEAWGDDQLVPFLEAANATNMELIEQPLPAETDAALAHIAHPVPICADESAHTAADITALKDRYDAVNIKLDKTGGLTEAVQMLKAAKANNMQVMVGSMVASSLAVAPATYLAQTADWVDLDGPLLLADDRTPPLTIENGLVSPPISELWG